MSCACGNQIEYQQCCGPFIEGAKLPATAEQLMRSRYTAFTTAQMDYLKKTNHPKTRGTIDLEANKQWAEKSKWIGLEVVNVEAGQAGDKEGKVEFIASYSQGDETHKHHEIGIFKTFQNQWFYVDGKSPASTQVISTEKKIGRNDPCSCGSGKKYKKCCGSN